MSGPPRSPIAACLVLLALLPAVAMADGLRCGGALITRGDDLLKVLAKCGEPAVREQYFIYRNVSHHYTTPRSYYAFRSGDTVISSSRSTHGHRAHSGYSVSGTIAIPVEVWTYNLGPNRFMRRLWLENGEVREVKTLGYGY